MAHASKTGTAIADETFSGHGGKTGTAIGSITATGHASPRTKRLIVIAGQSNAQGTGLAADLTGANATYADNYAAIQYVTKQDGNTDPPAWEETTIGDLRPVDYQGVTKHGIELSLGRDLNESYANGWAFAKFALGGTALASNWDPNGTYPTGETPNLFGQFVAYVQAAEETLGATLAGIIWIQGENDAGNSGTAAAYGTNLQEFVTELRSALGVTVPFLVGQLNAAYGGGAYTTDVRAGQAAAVAALPAMYLVDQDDVALGGDDVHYESAGFVELGHLYASALMQALGFNLRPLASFTTSTSLLIATFTDASRDLDGSITSWAWDFGDSSTSTAQNPSHTYAAAGTYTVALTVTDNDGATNTYSTSVTVSAVAWTVDATSGKAMPRTSAEWTAFLADAGLSGSVALPTSIYTCQDTGAPVVDAAGAFDLSLSGGGASYQQAVTGWDAKAITLTDGTTGNWFTTSASLPDLSASSCFVLAYIAQPASAPAATRFQMIMGTTSAASRLNSTGVVSTSSGGNSATGTEVATGRVMPVGVLVDQTANTQRCYTDQEKLGPTLGAVTGKAMRLGSTGAASSCGYLFAVRWDGADAEMSDATVKALLEALNWTIPWT